MINNDMLKNIEYLREKADVSYEEAGALLEKHGDNVMRVLVELEQQGRVYLKTHCGYEHAGDTQQQQQHACCGDAKKKATSLFDNAMKHRLIVERKHEDGSRETVANVNAPFVAGATIVAPWLMLATAGIAFATGHDLKLKKVEKNEAAE